MISTYLYPCSACLFRVQPFKLKHKDVHLLHLEVHKGLRFWIQGLGLRGLGSRALLTSGLDSTSHSSIADHLPACAFVLVVPKAPCTHIVYN